MRLIALEDALKPIHKKMAFYTVCKLIKACRKALGMKQARVAQLSGLKLERIKRIEKGFLLVMMKDEEIKGICNIFGIPFEELKKKMRLHIDKIEREKKIEVKCETSDKEEEMSFLRERERQEK